MGSPRPSRWPRPALAAVLLVASSGPARAASAEVKVDKDFLAAIVEKLPPRPFQKEGYHRGNVHGYRLVAIDPRGRRLLVACQVDGEFRPPIAGALARSTNRGSAGWRAFRFDVKATVNVEAGPDGTPRFRVQVEEVKRRELEGLAGTLALALGGYFDDMVTGLAAGRAALLNDKLNRDVLKRVEAFRQFGVLAGIDYATDRLSLRFENSRLKAEGVACHILPDAGPGTVPLYRWFRPGVGTHLYTTRPDLPPGSGFVGEGVVGHVYASPRPGTVPLYRWQGRRDFLLTASPDGEGSGRGGYRPLGVAFHAYPDPRPGTVPLYRFVDPAGLHLFTRHPYAELAR